MKGKPGIGPRFRIRGGYALIRPDSSPGRISATLPATSAPAARLKEPPAALDGFLQTGGCTESIPSRRHSFAPRRSTFPSRARFRSRGFGAHWPEPLTAPGAAQACPAGLPSPANQLTSADSLDGVRPFDPSSRLPSVGLRGDRIGGGDSSSSRENQPRATVSSFKVGLTRSSGLNVSPASEIAAASAPLGIPRLLKAIGQSDFPGGNHHGVFAGRKCSVLRGSGPLRSPSGFQILNVIK